MSEERLARYLELKDMEKEIATELDAIKKEIYALNQEQIEVGDKTISVKEQVRLDFQKDNVAKLIESAVAAGLINKESVETDYIKETRFKVIRVK